MAASRENNKGNNIAQQLEEQQKAATGQPDLSAMHSSMAPSLMSDFGITGDSMFINPAGATRAGEALAKYLRAFSEIWADSNLDIKPNERFRLVSVNESEAKGNVCMLAITYQHGDQVWWYGYLLGESMTAPRTASFQKDGPNGGKIDVELPRVPTDFADQKLMDAVNAKVKAAHGANCMVTRAGFTMLPETVLATNVAQIENLIRHAYAVIPAKLMQEPAFEAEMGGKQAAAIKAGCRDNLNVKIELNRTTVSDIMGTPKRSDIQLHLYNGTGDKAAKICTAHCYIDLTWARDDMNVNNFSGQQVRTFDPVLVLNHIDYVHSAVSGEWYLLSMIAMLNMCSSNGWANIFRSTYLGDNKNHDITAIVKDCGINGDISLRDKPLQGGVASMTDPEVLELINRNIKVEEISLASNIAIGSVYSVVERDFILAGTSQASTVASITKALQRLTDVEISGNLVDAAHPLYMGSYVESSTGLVRDYADIDYVYMRNMVDVKNDSQMMAYTNSFFDDEGRLSRLDLAKQYQPNIEPSHSGYRIMLNAQWLLTAVAALNKPEVQLVPKTRTHFSNTGNNRQVNHREGVKATALSGINYSNNTQATGNSGNGSLC